MNEAFGHRQEAFDHHADTVAIGMHAVLQFQLGVLDHPIEKEGIERSAMGFSKLRVDRIEAPGIILAHVRWCEHTDKEHGDAARFQLLQHGDEVFSALFRCNAAQRIVCTEFEDHAPGALRHRPVDTGEPARGCITRYACIGDRHIKPPGPQGLFEAGRKGILRRQLVSRHQAIPKADDGNGGTMGRKGRHHNCRDRQQKCPETFYLHGCTLKSVNVSHSGNIDILHIGSFPLAKTMIELKNADLTLGQAAASVHVLKGMNLKIETGQSVGIVGPSGSGKSTLLMVLAGLERLDRGEIVIAGTALHGLSEDRVAEFRGRNIGIVFQSFHLIPNMTALENVAVPLELANVRNAFDIGRQELASVGLGERLSHYPGQLSGGEQQRVAIARALAPAPKLLIADEPTGNLDAETGRQVADLIFSKQAERDMTLVLVTHDAALAARCSRQVKVRSGEIVSGAQSEPEATASLSKAASA